MWPIGCRQFVANDSWRANLCGAFWPWVLHPHVDPKKGRCPGGMPLWSDSLTSGWRLIQLTCTARSIGPSLRDLEGLSFLQFFFTLEKWRTVPRAPGASDYRFLVWSISGGGGKKPEECKSKGIVQGCPSSGYCWPERHWSSCRATDWLYQNKTASACSTRSRANSSDFILPIVRKDTSQNYCTWIYSDHFELFLFAWYFINI